ncbi:hypothetical protein BESB_067220 [Besnoitia besnoiti]|uniref:Uncharacterized protein n=1 Tax=Besnoitia besnoiti TaxID=94643 RepID=A0A2A9M9V5_BESBE|nr:hypothetical protein BESB_067220 [Besnoitia besnoiti]PFH34689.1 hypothetical protein BESB_067220 [Besnoitia besnoiti]
MLKVIAISCTLLSLLTRADQAGGDDEGDAANTNAEAEDVVTEDSASSGKRWTVTAPVSCDSVIQNTGAAVFKSAALLSLIALAGEMGVDMVDEYAPQGNPRFDDAWETIFTRSFQIIGVLRRVAIGTIACQHTSSAIAAGPEFGYLQKTDQYDFY